MTNSHNRQQTGARNAERYYSNASPQQQGGFTPKRRGQKSPHTTPFNSLTSSSTSLPLSISPNKLSGYYYNNNNSGNRHHQYHSNSNQRSSPGGSSSSSSFSTSPNNMMVSSSPPNFTYYAGSKCFDAPAPTALPQPPRHWKLSCAQSAAHFSKNDDFSHNLKMMLNVKA